MASEGKKYIANGMLLSCNQGVTPSPFSVVPTLTTLYDEPWATHMDAAPMVNIKPFGICSILSKSSPVPCVPATVMWQKVLEGGLTVNGFKPVLETSELPCSVGGTIKVFFSKKAAAAAVQSSSAHQNAGKSHEVADEAKTASLLLFGAAILTAVVVVGVTVATGGAALPLLALAGNAALAGAAVGAGVGAVAGGIEGYAHGGAAGAAEGAATGLFMGGIMGALGGAALAVGGAVTAGVMGLSALAFGVATAFDSKAFIEEPNLENGLVVVGDVVIMVGGLVGERLVKGVKESSLVDLICGKALSEGYNGIKATRIKNGTNGKVAVVGRKMAGHVEEFSLGAKKDGAKIELFNSKDQKGKVFEIEGKRYTFDEVAKDFEKGPYDRNEKGWIKDEDLPNTLMYKANKIWAEKLASEGYTVVDVGAPSSVTTKSVFYEIEKLIIFK